MEDLLNSFAEQSMVTPTEEGYKYHFVDGSPAGSEHARPDSHAAPAEEGYKYHFVDGSPAGSEHARLRSPAAPAEEGYKYHFVDGSPAGSEHAAPVRPAPTIPARSNHDDVFFDLKASGNPEATGFDVDDEANYNADVDDYDEEEESGREEEFHRSGDVGDNKISLNAAMYKKMSLFEDDIHDFDRSFHRQDQPKLETQGGPSRTMYKKTEPSLARNADGQSGSDGFAGHLRRLHRQDVERDELLTQLHQENMDLKRALDDSVPGGNLRAEAAERSLFEIRKALGKTPYACVLIDGRGYKIHEDLLQSGKKGGAEAADRMRIEVSNNLQQFGDAKDWDIMVHLYIDIEDLLARCVSADIPLSDKEVRSFMLGFTQAQPLFTIMDVGHDLQKMSQKIEGMFHFFANNVQCKHLIFGCCHNSAYALTLEPYASNPISASNITLLMSYEHNTYFKSLPFSSVEFPRVFRSAPFKETDRLATDSDYAQELSQQSDAGRIAREVEKFNANATKGDESFAKWPAAIPARAQPRPSSGWATEGNVLLNINDERVDPELGEVDYETSESMLDRMQVQGFCAFYHLRNYCATTAVGGVCKYQHGARLNDDELLFLKQYLRRTPCSSGSQCRKPNCPYGHVCANEPGCQLGLACPLYRLHEIDKTAVRVWWPGKNSSPRK